MANIPISLLPNVQPSGYTPNDLLVIVNNGVTKNTSLSDISSYVFSGYTFTGNTSATCITDLYVTNLHGCSPINVMDDLVMTSPSKIKSSIGGSEIDLNYFPNEIGITTDNGGYNDAYFYLSSAYTEIRNTIGNTIVMQPNTIQLNTDGYLTQFEMANSAITFNTKTEIYFNLNQGASFVTRDNSLSDVNSIITGDIPVKSVFIGSQNSIINSGLTNTVVIGGSGLTATESDTVYVSKLNINTVSAGTNSDDILVRTNTGQVKEIPVLGLPFSNVTGLTFNNANFDLTIGSDNGSAFTQSLSILSSDMTVTGGTYNSGTGTATFTTNSGNTFNVTGFLTGYTDTNIYNSNGSLTGNRTVNLNSYTLYFNDDINIDGVKFGAGANPTNNIAIGNDTLNLNVSGTDNIAFGTNSLSANTSGNKNISIGTDSLKENSGGNSNISIGYTSLYNNVNGQQNISLGEGSLYNNDGDENIAIGYGALTNNTSGNSNISLGKNSMNANLNGNSNISIGNSSLQSLTSDDFNVSIGDSSLLLLSSGVRNTSVGYGSLSNFTSGSDNVSIGQNSLYQLTTGNSNISLGAHIDMTSGNSNILIGNVNGSGISTGDYNVLLGNQITGLTPALSNNIIIADGQGNQRINVDSSGNVGLGTNSPTQRLSVDGNLNFTNTSFGGLRLNNLTTAQRNALTPAVGTVVYDTDLGVVCTYKGTFWDYTMIKTPSGTGSTTTSTVATNISGLAFSVESGSTYIIEGWMSIYCLSTGGVKFGHTYPSGAYATLWLDGINNNALSSIKTGTVGSLLPGTSTGFNSAPGTTQFSSVIVKGLITTTTNSGTFQLQFARGTGTAANVSITSNTFIKLTKIA